MVYGVLAHNNDEGLEAEVHDGQVRGNVVLVGDKGVVVEVHDGQVGGNVVLVDDEGVVVVVVHDGRVDDIQALAEVEVEDFRN